MIYKHILWITFFNEPAFIFCTMLNGFMNCYVTVRISHRSFVCIHSNGYRYM